MNVIVLSNIIMFQASDDEVHVLLILLTAGFLSEVNVNFMSQMGGTLDIQTVIMIDNFYKCLVLVGKAVK